MDLSPLHKQRHRARPQRPRHLQLRAQQFHTISSILSIRHSIARTVSRLRVYLQMLKLGAPNRRQLRQMPRLSTLIEHVVKKLNEQPLSCWQTLSANNSFTFNSKSKLNANPSSQSVPQSRSVRSSFNLSFGHANGNSSSSQGQNMYSRSSSGSSQLGFISFDFSTSANQSLYGTESHTLWISTSRWCSGISAKKSPA